MNTDKLKNIEKDRMLPNPTTEETAEEAAQRANAKRLAPKLETNLLLFVVVVGGGCGNVKF